MPRFDRLLHAPDENHEYPSIISSFYDMHTHEGVWAQESVRLQYEEMIKLRDLGANTPTGVPYTKKQILVLVIKGKQRGHIPGRGRLLRATTALLGGDYMSPGKVPGKATNVVVTSPPLLLIIAASTLLHKARPSGHNGAS
ncbi:hypothetical protein Tco_1434183 [Tanacetum coccineum]